MLTYIVNGQIFISACFSIFFFTFFQLCLVYFPCYITMVVSENDTLTSNHSIVVTTTTVNKIIESDKKQ